MTIRIVADSTCDLPQDIVDSHQVTIVPLYINFGNDSYLDRVEITREEFYTRLPDSNPLPTTATPGPERFRRVYEDLAAQGADEVLSIHISPSLSTTINAAEIGARQTESIPVTVFDSTQLSLGAGFLVETAAKAAEAGASMIEIIEKLRDQAKRTYVFAALETLEFLRRSGRMNGVIATLGSWLQMKPILTMNQGNPGADRVRTMKAALKRVVEMVEEVAPIERVGMVHTHAREQAEKLREMASDLLPEGPIPSVDITPVFGVHLGPGAIGFACISEE